MGQRHDTKILNVQILLSRNFVVIAQAPIEEKIQQRSRRRGQFSSSRFPCRKMPSAGISFRAAGKSVKNFPAASKFAGNFSSKEFRTATAFSSVLNCGGSQTLLGIAFPGPSKLYLFFCFFFVAPIDFVCSFLPVPRILKGFGGEKTPSFCRGFSFFFRPPKPQGPCHIKNTTIILIHYGGGKNTTVVKKYGRVSETPCFPGEKSTGDSPQIHSSQKILHT